MPTYVGRRLDQKMSPQQAKIQQDLINDSTPPTISGYGVPGKKVRVTRTKPSDVPVQVKSWLDSGDQVQ